MEGVGAGRGSDRVPVPRCNCCCQVRKSAASIFCFFVRNDVCGFGSKYLPLHTALLYQMADGYSSPDLALHCGAMLRECIKVSGCPATKGRAATQAAPVPGRRAGQRGDARLVAA